MAIVYKSYRPYDIDNKYDKDLQRCSLRNGGYMWTNFVEHRQCKRSKVVICFVDNKIVGWGIRFKYSVNRNSNYSIMLFVFKQYRRNGIGTQIYKKLTRGVKYTKLEVYPDRLNRKFFGRVYDKN